MRNRKRIMCGGLAFTDIEDMKMLHEYAKEGWIFKEFNGLFYILHKEEPQNMIFSYDMQVFKAEDEKQEYFQICEDSGWHIINPKTKSGIYFFWADEDTTPLHTHHETRMETYQSTFHASIGLLGIGVVCLFLSIFMWENLILFMIGLISLLIGAMLTQAILRRKHYKRPITMFSYSFQTGVRLICAGVPIMVLFYITDFYKPIRYLGMYIGFIMVWCGFINVLSHKRRYKDRKEMKKEREEKPI
ncbi:DUF2812 domain-containing protein [Erysipelotrichaceae bacterium HCN-30851]